MSELDSEFYKKKYLKYKQKYLELSGGTLIGHQSFGGEQLIASPTGDINLDLVYRKPESYGSEKYKVVATLRGKYKSIYPDAILNSKENFLVKDLLVKDLKKEKPTLRIWTKLTEKLQKDGRSNYPAGSFFSDDTLATFSHDLVVNGKVEKYHFRNLSSIKFLAMDDKTSDKWMISSKHFPDTWIYCDKELNDKFNTKDFQDKLVLYKPPLGIGGESYYGIKSLPLTDYSTRYRKIKITEERNEKLKSLGKTPIHYIF